MKYNEFVKYIGVRLKAAGYRELARGIFSKKINNNSCGWICITGNNFFISVAIGVLFPEINEISYEILGHVFPNSRKHQLDPSLGPPLVILPLHALNERASESEAQLKLEQPSEIIQKYADNIFILISSNAHPFFESNANIMCAIESAFKYCKFNQAQKYLIPIALASLKKRQMMYEYGRECIDTFNTLELRNAYIRFLDLIRARFKLDDASPPTTSYDL